VQLDGAVECGAVPPGADCAALAQVLDEQVGEERLLSVTHDQMVERFGRVMRILVAQGFRMPNELVLFFKNLLYLNGLADTLAPGLDLLGEVDPIFEYFKGKYEDALPYFGR